MEGFNPLHPPTHSLLHQKTAPAAAPQDTGKFGEAAHHLPSEVPTTHIHVCKCLDITSFLGCFSKNEIRAGGQCPPPPPAAGGSQTGSQQLGLPWQCAASRLQPSLWERKTRPGQPHMSASPHRAAPGGSGARANADLVPPVGNPGH